MVKWIGRREPTEAARMLLQREGIIAPNEDDLKIIANLVEIIPDEIFGEHKVDGRCYDRLPVRIGKEIVFVKQRSKDFIENATEIKCEETDRRKMMLHNAMRIEEDEKVEREEPIEFDGSPFMNCEKGKA
ncbi:hypothetical protein Tcan_03778 [Toxocara canis]|uniref:Uncharacterized protein n=2 Tax=Toxocara canis TaxID=6265 RepID=A0A0B2VZ34_TOXCA|nr:hypothetical protein Tcan_03778 [Toxocara canis]VDM38122.1 unnamed protein product [Toxocara canis]